MVALFRAWVEQHLAPVLKPGDVVVMAACGPKQIVLVHAIRLFLAQIACVLLCRVRVSPRGFPSTGLPRPSLLADGHRTIGKSIRLEAGTTPEHPPCTGLVLKRRQWFIHESKSASNVSGFEGVALAMASVAAASMAASCWPNASHGPGAPDVEAIRWPRPEVSVAVKKASKGAPCGACGLTFGAIWKIPRQADDSSNC